LAAMVLLIGPPATGGASITVKPLLTKGTVRDVRGDPAACRAALRSAGLPVDELPNVRDGRSCGYAGAVALDRIAEVSQTPLPASCAVTAGFAVWVRDVAQPAAERHFGQTLTRVELAGPAYSCRPIAGRADGRMSEHASANALDIAGFTLADGRTVTVLAGWRGSRPERAFLRDVRDGACGLFQTVLSPDYNAAHRDHLHLDMGRWQTCD
jgi:hypothetical protein